MADVDIASENTEQNLSTGMTLDQAILKANERGCRFTQDQLEEVAKDCREKRDWRPTGVFAAAYEAVQTMK